MPEGIQEELDDRFEKNETQFVDEGDDRLIEDASWGAEDNFFDGDKIEIDPVIKEQLKAEKKGYGVEQENRAHSLEKQKGVLEEVKKDNGKKSDDLRTAQDSKAQMDDIREEFGPKKGESKGDFVKRYNQRLADQRIRDREQRKKGIKSTGNKKTDERLARGLRVRSRSKAHQGVKIGKRDLDEEKPPLGFIGPIIVLMFLLVADLADYLNLVVPFLSNIFDLISFVVITVFLFFKKRRLGWNIAANIIEFIPYIDLLPIRTITFLVFWVIQRNVDKKNEEARQNAENENAESENVEND